MNKERLAELSPSQVGCCVLYSKKKPSAYKELYQEARRLTARDEWLTTLLGRALVHVDEANMPASWELGDAIRLAISKEAAL